MIGRINKTTCIWIPNGLQPKYVVSLCQPLSDILASRLKSATKANCSDCLRIAAQIAEDAKKLEKR